MPLSEIVFNLRAPRKFRRQTPPNQRCHNPEEELQLLRRMLLYGRFTPHTEAMLNRHRAAFDHLVSIP